MMVENPRRVDSTYRDSAPCPVLPSIERWMVPSKESSGCCNSASLLTANVSKGCGFFYFCFSLLCLDFKCCASISVELTVASGLPALSTCDVRYKYCVRSIVIAIVVR
jgi:hypothetical protein